MNDERANAKPDYSGARALRPDEKCHYCSRMVSEWRPLMWADGKWVCVDYACAKEMQNAKKP